MLTEAIEQLLNRGVPRSPRAQALLEALHGRRIAIDVRGVARLTVEAQEERISLKRDSHTGEPVEAEVRGGPLAMLALAGKDAQAVLQRGEVTITGDTDLAQRYRELALALRPDLEEELSQLIGDAGAHQAARLARQALAWTRRAAETAARNTAEYLAHERGDLVPRAEADQFLRGVDALRESVDRLEARIERLEKRS